MRIQKLNSDLELKATFLLETKPRQIKIIERLACIRSLHDGLYFYDLVNFELKFKYGQTSGFIFVHDNMFFQFNNETMDIDLFDKDALHIEKIYLKLHRDCDFEGYFVAGFVNEKFICQWNHKKIAIV